MNGYDLLHRVRDMVLERCRAIEEEKIAFPRRISDLRLESADMETILDAIGDIEESRKGGDHE